MTRRPRRSVFARGSETAGSLHEARGVAVPADLLGPGFVATPYGSELPGCNPL